MKICILMLAVVAAMPSYAQQNADCGDVAKKLASAEKKLNDWPELNRYRDDNLRVAPLKKGEVRVVFLGDSITDLWDDPGFGGFFPGKPYIDRGIGGQTTPQMLLRFHADVIDNRPSVFVLLAGTNDISANTGPMTLKQTGDNISAMAELARSRGIKVVLSSVLPVSDTVRKPNGEFYLQTRSRPPARIVEMNEWLKSYAAREGYTYLDYYSAMVDEHGFVKDGLTFDGLHPNAKGYAIMSQLAEKAIQKALKSRK
jgi:lysophospholipase L1-like esterase